MSHKAKNRSLVILAVLLALTACGLIASTIYALRLPDQIAEQDTIILGQGQRGILEFRFKYPGKYMFHAHKTEFAELGWTGVFEVEA